jgi:hypothetical protein
MAGTVGCRRELPLRGPERAGGGLRVAPGEEAMPRQHLGSGTSYAQPRAVEVCWLIAPEMVVEADTVVGASEAPSDAAG